MSGTAGTTAIGWERVTKRFEGRAVLDALSLDAPAGRTTVLVGPSGSGKSTLIRLAAGLESADDGSVTVLGRPCRAGTIREIRARIGYVIQEGGLFPHLTAGSNVTLVARRRGWSAARGAERLAELAEVARFPADRFDSYPDDLSGGERQRVALMRALMLDPPLLLLDEPLGALDPLTRADLQRDLAPIFAAPGRSVLLVTHDLFEARHFADRLVLMNGGRVEQAGPPEELFDTPATAFSARFVAAQRSLYDRGAR